MTQRQVGWSGLAVGALFGVGNAVWTPGMPRPGAPAEEIVRFYRATSGRIVAGASMSLLAIALFVFFASGLRRRVAEAEGGDVLATTAFGGALLGTGAGLGAETINLVGALRARDDELSDSLAQAVYEISQVLGFNAAGVGVGTFAVSVAAASLRSGAILPRWLAVVTAVVGLTLLTPLSRVTFPLAVLLLMVIAALLVREPA